MKASWAVAPNTEQEMSQNALGVTAHDDAHNAFMTFPA